MPRKLRVVLPNLPHHVTQRGNNRQDIFHSPRDRKIYLDLLFRSAEKQQLRIWGYCLMTNHIHLIAVPEQETSLAKTLGQAHSAYSMYWNSLHGRSGHLWQARYFSAPMDTRYSWTALAYVENNPVRAGIVHRAESYAYSSAAAHTGQDTSPYPLDLLPWQECFDTSRWTDVLRTSVEDEALEYRSREARLALAAMA